jgi:hypothetical protein
MEGVLRRKKMTLTNRDQKTHKHTLMIRKKTTLTWSKGRKVCSSLSPCQTPKVELLNSKRQSSSYARSSTIKHTPLTVIPNHPSI